LIVVEYQRINTEENVMTCTDGQFIPEDDLNTIHSGEDSLSRFVELLAPLVNQGYTWIDIGEDIMIPAQRCGSYDRNELNGLSTVFSILLQKMSNAMLCALTAYLSMANPRCILGEFVDSMRDLTDAVVKARDNTLIEVFRLGVLEEVGDERI